MCGNYNTLRLIYVFRAALLTFDRVRGGKAENT